MGASLPLIGAYFAGRPLAPYLRLSPDLRVPAPSSFEWPAFLIYALIILAVGGLFVWRIAAVRRVPPIIPVRPFPWWGWAGFALTVIAWVLAWSRLTEFRLYQPYTFAPLWLGYILTVNGLVHRRTGRCLLLRRPVCFLVLFPASAAFWWCFEYLNRYVGNWYYVGLEFVSPLEYFTHATVSFSTVLPAVVSTRDWLASFPRLRAAFTDIRSVPWAEARALPRLLLLAGGAGFVALGAWPHYFYAMVWLAPLLALVSLQALGGLPNLLADIRRGDWRDAAVPALAGLVAGFFWELWNWRSFARWEYNIPLVDGLLLFEMPILGYAGYLPFGIVCIAVSMLVCGVAQSKHG